MDLAYKAADIVISRAGASSLSELSALGKASVLVPSPNVTEDHQTKNAMALVNKKAAEIVKDTDAKKDLVPTALNLLADKPRLAELSKNILALGKPNATDAILNEIELLVG